MARRSMARGWRGLVWRSCDGPVCRNQSSNTPSHGIRYGASTVLGHGAAWLPSGIRGVGTLRSKPSTRTEHVIVKRWFTVGDSFGSPGRICATGQARWLRRWPAPSASPPDRGNSRSLPPTVPWARAVVVRPFEPWVAGLAHSSPFHQPFRGLEPLCATVPNPGLQVFSRSRRRIRPRHAGCRGGRGWRRGRAPRPWCRPPGAPPVWR